VSCFTVPKWNKKEKGSFEYSTLELGVKGSKSPDFHTFAVQNSYEFGRKSTMVGVTGYGTLF
jgi:hypothetical protein